MISQRSESKKPLLKRIHCCEINQIYHFCTKKNKNSIIHFMFEHELTCFWKMRSNVLVLYNLVINLYALKSKVKLNYKIYGILVTLWLLNQKSSLIADAEYKWTRYMTGLYHTTMTFILIYLLNYQIHLHINFNTFHLCHSLHYTTLKIMNSYYRGYIISQYIYILCECSNKVEKEHIEYTYTANFSCNCSGEVSDRRNHILLYYTLSLKFFLPFCKKKRWFVIIAYEYEWTFYCYSHIIWHASKLRNENTNIY